ncbi:FAD-binding oxidoreductase [Salinirubellus salinus]|uniref:D-lactate dehydrogenase (cytochrome) n=1 Tax=Salinirubellus salinus TaxID=1364945 RepID=A0A9E7R0G3_9EURY|nr:FAD-binding oxidoreductase [Salinirubellus salinus]UWM53366.1 FAD-binding oxidoreductase [Salinirubellus salinus]
MSHDTEFLDGLLPSARISRTRADRTEHSIDWGTDEADAVLPDAVVWPERTEEVASVLSAANEHGVPVTPYAAGTSLEGNAVPVEEGISMDLSRMDDVHDIRPDDRQVDVGPGILGDEVNEAVEKHGLFLPALPSSGAISTIGGMIANDASGMKTVKYGEVGDWVLELEAVLPSGEVITAGSKAIKTSAGYNLKELLIGSEGTLAVVTRVTLQLAGRPEQVWGGRATFPTVADAGAAIADAVRSGVDVAKIELIDELSVDIANEHLDTDLSDSPMVFLEFHANHGIEQEVEFCRTVFEGHDVEAFTVTESDAEMAALWAARRELADALEPYRDDLSLMTPGDVTVPISKYPDILAYVEEQAEEHDLLVSCFGHAGDGNLHYNILVDDSDPERLDAAATVSKQIVHRAIELGGTATGEHGVGLGKQEYLEPEHGTAALGVMRGIKRSFDPNGILNPGKVLPDPED